VTARGTGQQQASRRRFPHDQRYWTAVRKKKRVPIKDDRGDDAFIEVDFKEIDGSLIQAALAKSG
jgi:hypothetical protein